MDDLLKEFLRIYQGRAHIQGLVQRGALCSDRWSTVRCTILRSSVPNTLHLDLYAGVLVLVIFEYFQLTAVVPRSVWRGTADAALSFDSIHHVKQLLSSQIGTLFGYVRCNK